MPNPNSRLKEIATLIAVMFLIQVGNMTTGMWFTQFGIIPRSHIGLRGVVFAPLLHGSWGHLLANVGPLAVMLGLLSLHKKYSLWSATAAIWVTAGLAIWIFGRPGSIQIGASSLIYGLATFLITAGLLDRDLFSALIAFFVIVVYGGLFWGLFPAAHGVSWEGHVCGAVAGIAVAKFSGRRGRR